MHRDGTVSCLVQRTCFVETQSFENQSRSGWTIYVSTQCCNTDTFDCSQFAATPMCRAHQFCCIKSMYRKGQKKTLFRIIQGSVIDFDKCCMKFVYVNCLVLSTPPTLTTTLRSQDSERENCRMLAEQRYLSNVKQKLLDGS